MTTETWRVIDEAGAVHEIEVGQVRGSAAWCARVRSYEAPVVHSDPRGAVVIAAMRDGVGIAEVLAPGEASAGTLRGLLDAVRAALGPTCADATHEALPWLIAEVVACDAAMHARCEEQRMEAKELRAEVAHLEARRGALLAEIDRLAATLREVARG